MSLKITIISVGVKECLLYRNVVVVQYVEDCQEQLIRLVLACLDVYLGEPFPYLAVKLFLVAALIMLRIWSRSSAKSLRCWSVWK